MLNSSQNLLVRLLTTVSVAGLAWAACPQGDLTGDCKVDFDDMQILTDQWLDPEGSQADLDRRNGVETRDFALLAGKWRQKGIPLVINEFMASNSKTKADPQGQYDDWIEIYNAGSFPIDTGGMHLTDNLDNPTKWQIPAGNPTLTTILAGHYLLIWADNDTQDNGAIVSGLHAGFELNADTGDEVGLFDGNSVLIDSVEFPDQTANISYGRYPDANNTWRFLSSPTPGNANVGAYLGQVADTQFSQDRGFYDAPFSVTLATETEEAKIYYTTDGSSPLDTAGEFPRGVLYGSPITINTTTCLRTVAFKPGFKPTNVDAQTYIFPNDVIRQPANIPGYPNPRTWLGGSSYAYHDYEMDPEVVNDRAYSGMIKDALKAIPTMSIASGRAAMDVFYWGSGESVVSVELIYPNDPQKNVQATCGVEPHSHNRMKRSMRLNFRAEYGDSRFRSSIFQDAPLNGDSAVDELDRIVLRGGNNRSWARVWNPERTTYTMDQWYRDTQIVMSGIGSHGTFVHLYINGLYWGLYNPCERPDAWFTSSYLRGEREDWYAVSHDGSHGGDASRFNYLKGALKDKDMSDPANYAEMKQYLDIEEYIDYLILTWFIGMTDWPAGNWWGGNRNDVPGPFMYFAWDGEWSWKTTRGHNNGWVHPDFRSNQSGGATIAAIWHSLRRNPDFMLSFADRAYKHLLNDGPLTDENCKVRYTALNDFVRDAVVAESARWGDTCEGLGQPTRTRDVDFVFAENETLGPGFMTGNRDKFIASLKNEGYYPELEPPQFNLHGGHFGSPFAVTLSNPNGSGKIYYTVDGSDPRVPAVSTSTGSTKLVEESDDKRVLVPVGPISDNWRGGGYSNDSGWTYVSGNPGGVGYERGSGYESYISIDLGAEMYNTQNTCYIRVPFTVEAGQLVGFDSMTLRMRYDDGFIAYINGTPIAWRNFDGVPAWNSAANNTNPDASAKVFEDVDVTAYLGALRADDNILAVHGLNNVDNQSDFLVSVELVAGNSGTASPGGDVAPTAIEYAGPRSLGQSIYIKTRTKSGSSWSPLNEAVFAVGPVAESLRISEIMYHPLETGNPDDPNEEFIELRNIGPNPINLNLVRFTNGIGFTFGDIELGTGEDVYVVVVAKQSAFADAHPGFSGVIAGEYTGSLDNGGERIELQDALGQTIHNFAYKDGWRGITDGEGFSLTVIDPTNPDPNSWGRKDSWRASASAGGSPGCDDSPAIPNPGAIVINELLAHSHGVAADWIELYNTTDEDIDIGGWYLSDTEIDTKKYKFADGTKIRAYDYLVLYEDANFGEASTDPCSITGFGFSENGDNVCLRSAEDGVLTGYREAESFGASQTGVSFGRYFKRSTGSYNFVHTDYNTPGWANAYPEVGPIVINEIMYNPDWPVGGNYSNDRYEYIELRNVTAEPVTLYRFDKALPWKFTEGIEFIFPAWPSAVTIPAGDHIVVVRDLNAFTWRYPAVPAGKIFGPYTGQLANEGEQVELSMPGDIDEFGRRHYIRIDRVGYSDGSHPGDEPGDVDLWPVEADGGGKSLARKVASLYGNDPNNWIPATPSPGGPNP